MSPNASETTASSPTIACLCLFSMRNGPPLADSTCWNENVASLLVEPLIDVPMLCMPTPQEEQDTRKRSASSAVGMDALAMSGAEHAASRLHLQISGIVLGDSPLSKKRRTNESSAVCHLLEARPEVLRYIRSFLSLQDALTLKSTCKTLHNDGYDAYRYSCLLTCKALAKDDFKGPTCTWPYLQKQEYVLMRNQNDEKLRAILLNDFIPSYHLRRLIWSLLKTTKTDNASAVSILLEDGRCDVDPFMLDQALRKNFTQIAAVLQQNDRVKAGIQMCATCNENIGCFECFRALDCCVLPEPAQGRIWCSWEDLPPRFRQARKYCRKCVLADNTFCKVCNEYLCPECRRCQNHGTCETCHGILCMEDFFSKQPILVCDECPRMKCRSCLTPGEGWLEVVDGGFPITLCPNCKSSYEPGQISST